MNILIKSIATILISGIATSLLWTWYNVFITGAYYNNASIFLTLVVGITPILILILSYYAIKLTLKLKLNKL
jgi:hypothetical protein